MEFRAFGNTDMKVSQVGFGAWGIGGPSMAGDIPIGWGDTDPKVSEQAIRRALQLGINFYDTADFYGLGYSEELLGKVIGDDPEALIATKVGHRLAPDNSIFLDYSREYVLSACDESLRRLKRERIDYYQLHAAKLDHLREGDCLEAMEELQQAGKIRYWGLSVNTFYPEREGDYLLELKQGHGFQCVLNVINQKSLDFISRAGERGYGIIARMPLQFGLLTGKFGKDSKFDSKDHRSFRFNELILSDSLDGLERVWPLADKYGISKTSLALSYILSYPGVSTVIPGIKTPEQAELNTTDIIKLQPEDRKLIEQVYQDHFHKVVDLMEEKG